MYSNEKIEQLIAKRKRLDREIESEMLKEKAKYKFSYKRLALLLSLIILPPAAVKINTKIFPETSIWSWHHYIKNL